LLQRTEQKVGKNQS
jgi:hypothetical protein